MKKNYIEYDNVIIVSWLFVETYQQLIELGYRVKFSDNIGGEV